MTRFASATAFAEIGDAARVIVVARARKNRRSIVPSRMKPDDRLIELPCPDRESSDHQEPNRSGIPMLVREDPRRRKGA